MIAPDADVTLPALLPPVVDDIQAHGSATIIVFGPECWAFLSAEGGGHPLRAEAGRRQSGSLPAAGFSSVKETI